MGLGLFLVIGCTPKPQGFQGYGTVYVASDLEIKNAAGAYPIYWGDDSTLFIDYKDGVYALHRLNEPMPLPSNNRVILKWRFKDIDHYVEDIPAIQPSNEKD